MRKFPVKADRSRRDREVEDVTGGGGDCEGSGFEHPGLGLVWASGHFGGELQNVSYNVFLSTEEILQGAGWEGRGRRRESEGKC